jgi:short-subunit dehydrogenase
MAAVLQEPTPRSSAGAPESGSALHDDGRRFRCALITGASSGLGRAIALELAARGTLVWLAARRLDELERTAALIRLAGGRAEARALDVADTDAVLRLVAAWDLECGGFDLVLANAGVGSHHDGADPSFAHELAVWRVNVLGATATLCAAAAPMLARGRGTLAAVTSLGGRRGMPRSGAYSASKAALTTYLESLRVDLAPRGLCVVEIRPGFVRTAMTDRNRFRMPFLWPVERAARVSVAALEAGRPVCAFPWQLVLLLGSLRLLPTGWYTAFARRMPQARRES